VIERLRFVTKRRDGQTLIIAMFVLFIMLFLGLVFVGLIARNLFFSQRATNVTTADNFSEAGIRYAHQQLLTSPEGADWRPDPDNLPVANATDPDYEWLRAPDPGLPGDLGGPKDPISRLGTGCYSRILFDKGRALIRLTYDPARFDPNAPDRTLARYMKIESVGRVGAFRLNDPTLRQGATGTLFKRKVAYAAIGITDYARFDTNIDRKAEPVELGIPGDFGAFYGGANVSIPMTIGNAAAMARYGAASSENYGGSIRINSGLKIYGDLRLYLNPTLGDKLLVVGDIQYADQNSRAQIFSHTLANPVDVRTSADPSFSTYGNRVRDNRRWQDPQGYPRAVERLEPPIINQVDVATGRERYRAATRDSGKWYVGSNGRYFNSGQIGYGEGVYVDNEDDTQAEVTEFAGGASLRADWLKPGGSENWQGPFYIPPGAYIQLLPDGFRITRNSKNDDETWRTPLNVRTSLHSLRFWVTPDANSPTGMSIYDEFSSPQNRRSFNGVIYCEGNIRVRGIIPQNSQLTIVSNATAYIEGSIIKYRDASGNTTSMASILAKDYVALNSTMFVGPTVGSPMTVEPDTQDVVAPYHINVEQLKPFTAQFSFALSPGGYTGDAGRNPRLYVRHSASARASYINILMNYGAAPANSEYLFENTPPNAAGFFYGTQNWIPGYGLADSADQVFPRYEHRSFQIFPTPGNFGSYALDLNGLDNTVTFQSGPRISTASGNRPYYLSAVTVQPMDVKIEAMVYAQQGSFFVIPGPWFNPNPNDRRDRFSNQLTRLNNFGAYPDYPFYGEPLDIRVSIIGAVAENFAPQMSDQEEWLRHWAWIPKEFGASGTHIPTEHEPPGFNSSPYVPNLAVVYDPCFSTASVNGIIDQNAQPLRTDRFGRWLPPTPKLPVSPQLLYFGEVRP